jgi:hypothetical protein
VRENLEEKGDVEKFPRRKDTAGRRQPSSKPPRRKKAAADPAPGSKETPTPTPQLPQTPEVPEASTNGKEDPVRREPGRETATAEEPPADAAPAATVAGNGELTESHAAPTDDDVIREGEAACEKLRRIRDSYLDLLRDADPTAELAALLDALNVLRNSHNIGKTPISDLVRHMCMTNRLDLVEMIKSLSDLASAWKRPAKVDKRAATAADATAGSDAPAGGPASQTKH